MFSRASTAILALLTLPSLTSALAVHNSARPQISPEDLFRRDSTCGDSAYVQCGADLPSDFCCPATSTCMVLAGKTTALCCPTGGDCGQIQAIPCDLSLEDKSKYPSATVMTSALTGTLEACGTKCCPFGYSCGDDGVCNLNDDQSAKPSTSSASSSSSTAASSSESSTTTQTAEVTPTTGASSSATSTSDPSSSSSGSSSAAATAAADTTATSSSSSAASTTTAAAAPASSAPTSSAGLVAGGIIGGIAGFLFLGLLIVFFIKRERKRKALAQDSASAGGDGGERGPSTSPPQISQPILNGAGTWRSDFSRKASTRENDDTGAEGFEDGAAAAAGAGGAMYHHDADDFGGDNYEVSEHSNVSFVEHLSDDDDEVSSMREVPRIITPVGLQQPQQRQPTGNARTVSSMYGSFYDPGNDPNRASAYQAPLKMPSARAFGGNDKRVSVAGHDWLGDPRRDSYAASGPTASLSPRAGGSGVSEESGRGGYINVFADSNAIDGNGGLLPSPLEVGEREKRETRFSDFGRS